jgi:glyoxylase-like metal-dependent hydrolase (beta-lactamase superfamily II)
MKIFSRFALLLLAAGTMCPPAGAQAPSQIPEIMVRRLSPRAAMFNLGSSDKAVAVLALATQKGIVVVDAPHDAGVAKAFRDAIQAEFHRTDFAYLINSRGHHDHTGGNSVYADLPIIGHESERSRALTEIAFMRTYFLKNDPKLLETPQFTLYEQALPKTIETPKFAQNEEYMKQIVAAYRGGLATVPPTITFDNHLTLNLGDVTLQLIYYGQAHSPSDIIISVPEENLAVTGSLFFPGQLPPLGVRGNPVDGGTAFPEPRVVDNWLVVLRQLVGEANESTRFIPVHGNVFLNKADYQRILSYLEKLWGEVRRLKAEGKTLEQAKATLPLKERFPEVADLRDEMFKGTKYETLGIHQYNVEFLWKTLEK